MSDTPTPGGGLEMRARMFVADLVDSIDVPPENADTARPTPSPNRRRSLLAGVAAAITLMLVMAGLKMVPGRFGLTPAVENSSPTLPAELPVHRTGRHTDRVFVHSPSALYPDGRFFAWVDGPDDRLRIDDLSTDGGPIVEVDLAPVRALSGGAEVAGWSADSGRVYVVPAGGGADGPAGRWWEIGVDGAMRRIGLEDPVRTATAAPDGTLAVVRRDGGVDIVSPEGKALARSVVVPSGVATGPTTPTEQRRRDRDEGVVAVQALWAPSGSVAVVVEDQRARLFSRRSEAGDMGTLVTAYSTTTDTARRIQLDRFDCVPVAVLSDSLPLCATEEVTLMKDGLTTVDLSTGERRVVALLPPQATRVSVAADLARTWRFEMDEPWPLPPSE